jgi:hypothetical protein
MKTHSRARARGRGFRALGVLAVIAVSVSGMSAHGADLTSPPIISVAASDSSIQVSTSSDWNPGLKNAYIQYITNLYAGSGPRNTIRCVVLKDCVDLWINRPKNSSIQANIHLPLCSSDEQIFCIESASEVEDGNNVLLEFEGYFQANPISGTYAGLPSSASPSLWRGGASNQLYILDATSESYQEGMYPEFSFTSLDIRLYAVSEVKLSSIQQRISFANEGSCLALSVQACYLETAFPKDIRLSIDVRSSNSVGRWLNGRLLAPAVSAQSPSAGVQIISVEAEPVVVPRFSATVSREKWLKAYGVSQENFPSDITSMVMKDSWLQTVNALSSFVLEAGNKSHSSQEVWHFDATNRGTLSNSSQCGKVFADGVLGVVTTNSMAYEGGPPKFDSGYLSYKVAGLHYAPDGETINEGTYDLVVRSDVARCLYGFKNAPISATVAVVGEMGEEKVATTIVSEKDGWLKLAAYGFTFSEKEIQVKLRQSQIKTLSDFSGSTTSLSSAQKSQIRSVLSKSDGNTKFICTGIRYFNQPLTENIKVRARAKAACDYAKSLNPNFSYWYQTKTTQARSYNGKVMIVSKG